MTILAVRYAGILSPNPFWLNLGPGSSTLLQALRALEEGWGGIVWRTLTAQSMPGRVPTFFSIRRRLGESGVGVGINDPGPTREIASHLNDISEVKRRFPENPLIVPIAAELNKTAWSELAKQAEGSGCDGIEIAFRHPLYLNLEQQSNKVQDAIKQAIGWVKKAVSIPVIVKLCPDMADILPGSEIALKAGAAGLTLIGPLRGIGGVDLETQAPQPTIDGLGTYVNYQGYGIKPLALAAVADVARQESSLPICGAGGIESWREAVEFILLGATVVQISEAVLREGYRIIGGLKDGLESYLQSHGLRAVGELRGKALEKTTDWTELSWSKQATAAIDQMRCIGCGLCYIACRDGSIGCISMSCNDFFNRFHVEESCNGCGICLIACPVMDCIKMEARGRLQPPARKKVTQNE